MQPAGSPPRLRHERRCDDDARSAGAISRIEARLASAVDERIDDGSFDLPQRDNQAIVPPAVGRSAVITVEKASSMSRRAS